MAMINNILSILKTTPVHADALGNQISTQITNVSSQTTIPGLVNSLISLAIPLGVLCAIGLMIVAGYNMITSQGNPEKLTERQYFTDGIINRGKRDSNKCYYWICINCPFCCHIIVN